MTSDRPVLNLTEFTDSEVKMPVLFVGHGNPMNAIEENEFSQAWERAGKMLPKPKAILCVSAHWETSGTAVTAMSQPRTIHDFYGFPKALFEMQYPAKGSPQLARLVWETVKNVDVKLDYEWGLDHGAWSVLCRMFPNADVPVVQLSLDRTKDPAFHYELGKELRALRRKGVLIVGSGNIVHNLAEVVWQDEACDWAINFDKKLAKLILSEDHEKIVHYQTFGELARLSVPTPEHYLPLLYILALQEKGDKVSFFADKVTLCSMSMRSVRIG